MLKRLRQFLTTVPSRLYGSRIGANRETVTWLSTKCQTVPMAYLEILDKKLAVAREKLGEVQPKGRGIPRLVEDQDDYRPIG